MNIFILKFVLQELFSNLKKKFDSGCMFIVNREFKIKKKFLFVATKIE